MAKNKSGCQLYKTSPTLTTVWTPLKTHNSCQPGSSRHMKERGARGRHVRGEGALAQEAHKNRFTCFLRVQKIPIG